MSMPEKLKHELKSLAIAFVYFTLWIGALMLIKKLILEEYQIEVKGLSVVLLGALILSKVVLLMEPIPLGSWVKHQPAWVGVVLRTFLYSIGVLIVMLLEKGLDGRHEYGGFGASLKALFQHPDLYHILANTVCLSGALLGFNMLDVLKKRLGEKGLARMFTTPIADEK